ncbi:unnamed protein product [Ostreobium quekettii]|uniref:Uncharacterized protein n=1 Tax=Ostreobium quekettii TaxID=121088 RepID=A0A8S1IJQ8_9CHLO|nr:unnamed protein product [Ostreobium quekettii]CAD7701273.1 unnamed protein product [Ostreobium quekettii]|eukprot:evm.model.scf_706.3 EVM.evm.TU.scf_706.3   scf_706:58710-64812(-)
MSVVGFDVGNGAACVALARKGGIDVLMNKESSRETPSLVSFGDKMRSMGTEAAAKLTMRPKATVAHIKRLLGRKYADPEVQADLSRLAYPVREDPATGGCLVEVEHCGERRAFAPEQIMAMVLVDLKGIVAAEQGVAPTDCVVSVPAYYCEAERRAMLDACRIAGLKALRLMNETTATALAYGIFKTDLPDEEPTHVAFVDVGHSSFQVCVAALTKKKLKILSTAWSRSTGGWDFDNVLFEHCAKEFLEKSKLDVKTNPKSAFRLRVACEKAKKILSANNEAVLSVECLMEDTDFRCHITREQFEKLAEPLFQRLAAPLQQALDDAKLKPEQIASVEVVGNSSRVPAVISVIESHFKKPASRTLHAKECVSRGCALQCAMLSPIFRVRSFEVVDSQQFSIVFKWDKEGQSTTNMMFEKGTGYPCTKLLTFIRSEPFTITAEYEEDPRLPVSVERVLGLYQIAGFTVPKGAEKAKLKVKVRLSMHGVVDVESVQAIEEEEVEVPVTPKAKPKEAAPTPPPAEAQENQSASNGQEEAPPADVGAKDKAPEEEKCPEEEEKPKTEKKKRTKKIEVPISTVKATGLPQKVLEDYFELEGKMAATDKLQEETNDRKNELEAYVYSLRNKLCDALAPYIQEGPCDDLRARLDAMEDWLYDEGEDQTKSVYVAKLQELRKLGDPVELRHSEEQARGPALQCLTDTCNVYLAMARSDAKEYAHIEPAKREQVVKECEAALGWMQEKMAIQQGLEKHDDPAIMSADVYRKRDVLERVCKPIMSEPPPPPPKKKDAAKPAGDKEGEKEGEEAMDVDGGAKGEGNGAEGEGQPGGDEMEVDSKHQPCDA